MTNALITTTQRNMEVHNAQPATAVAATAVTLPAVTADQFIQQQLQTMPEAEAAIAELRARADALKIDGLDDVKGYKDVDELRKEAKRRRGAVNKHQEALLEVPKKFTKAVKERAGQLMGLLEAIEEECEAKQQPIKDEQARIKREEEERQRKEIEAKLLRDERERNRSNQLFKAGFSFNGEVYSVAINGQEFKIQTEQLRESEDDVWEEIRASYREWKNTVLPPVPAAPPVVVPAAVDPQPEYQQPQPVFQPAPAPTHAPAPTQAPAIIQQPEPEQHFNVLTSAPAGFPTAAKPAVHVSAEFDRGFGAAKAIIIAKLHEPEKLNRQQVIDYISGLTPQIPR